jgi:hypothetical protein
MEQVSAAKPPASTRRHRRWRWVRYALIGVVSLFSALVALELGFRRVPQAIPLGACESSLTLSYAFCHYEYQYDDPPRLGYVFQPGFEYNGPWNPADAATIHEEKETCGDTPDETFHYAYRADDHGFVNNATPWPTHYDVVVTGDSFAKPWAPVWWVDLLRQQTGMSVLNLGMDGWATLSEVEAVRMYGLDKHPRWVILVYFEGNDLFGVGEYYRRWTSGVDWRTYQLQQVSLVNRLVVPHVLSFWGDQIRQVVRPEKHICRYPMTVATNVSRFQTVFFDVQISQLSASRSDIESSLEWKLATQAILDLRDEVVAQGGRFLLVYVPAKEHLYWARIWDIDDIGHFLELTTPLRSYQEFTDNVDAQMVLMQEFAAANGVELLNLTGEIWQRTMDRGTQLYNYADMHWNEAGNRLVARLIADYINEGRTPPWHQPR